MTKTLCPACMRGSHDKCWKTWANMNMDDLTMGQNNQCVCETCFPVEALPWVFDDGGRAAAGYKGQTGDCVTRSIAIGTGHSYQDVYDLINLLAKDERITKRNTRRSSARTGVGKRTSKAFMTELGGWTWVPTMGIGTGTTVHLRKGELPMGRLIVACSKHWTAVIDGVVHDIGDPSREGTRAVYGYWIQDEVTNG